MKKDGKLRLELLDVYGNFLREKVDVRLRHQVLSHSAAVSVSASKPVLITDLFAVPQGLYRVDVDPPSYLPVSRFVSVKAGGVTDLRVTFPVDPKKVKKVSFPKFEELPEGLRTLLANSDDVFAFPGGGGKRLYGALDDVRRAGLLNIAAKTQAAPLTNGGTVFPHLLKIIELRGDRFFAYVQKELREEVKNSVAEGLFRPAGGALHHLPERFSGFADAGSYKTDDAYGNLQLTFFMKGDECVADIDIDDAAGLGHVFQVLRNTLTSRPTHPYDIHEILAFHQNLDPGYRFQV
jgi:hypothetical protein